MNWFKAVVLSMLLCAIARPSTVTYTETGSVTGFFNLAPFTDTLMTVVLTSSTSSVMSTGTGIFENQGTATLTLAGVISSPLTFTDAMAAFDEQFIPAADSSFSITDINGSSSVAGQSVLATQGSAFATYALATSIGPITDTGGIDNGPFPTTGGSLILSSLDPNTTMTATISAGSIVPEPSLLIPVFVALIGIGLRGRVSGIRSMWMSSLCAGRK